MASTLAASGAAALTSSATLRGSAIRNRGVRSSSSNNLRGARGGVVVFAKFVKPEKAAATPASAPAVAVTPADASSQAAAAPSITFEAPNQYGYFDSAIAAAETKRAKRLDEGYTSIKAGRDTTLCTIDARIRSTF